MSAKYIRVHTSICLFAPAIYCKTLVFAHNLNRNPNGVIFVFKWILTRLFTIVLSTFSSVVRLLFAQPIYFTHSNLVEFFYSFGGTQRQRGAWQIKRLWNVSTYFLYNVGKKQEQIENESG